MTPPGSGPARRDARSTTRVGGTIRAMTFPLGSLRGDGAPASRRSPARARATRPPALAPSRAGAAVGCSPAPSLWLLAVLALATHSAADAGVLDLRQRRPDAEQGRHRSAPGSPTSPSSCSATRSGGCMLVGAARLARRAGAGAAQRRAGRRGRAAAAAGRGTLWLGLALLLAASAALEWTRLYQWEAQVAGGHAGGVLGYSLGTAEPEAARLRRLGRAVDRRCWWPASRWRSASPGCGVAERHRRAASSRCARAAPRASSAPRTCASARRRCASARRSSRSSTQLQEEHLPIVIEPTAGRRAEEHAGRQGAAEAALHRAGRHQAAAGRPARLGAARAGDGERPRRSR